MKTLLIAMGIIAVILIVLTVVCCTKIASPSDEYIESLLHNNKDITPTNKE